MCHLVWIIRVHTKIQIYPLADLRGESGTRPPWGSKIFHFHAVFGKILQNNPNLRVGTPPRKNPGSATVTSGMFVVSQTYFECAVFVFVLTSILAHPLPNYFHCCEWDFFFINLDFFHIN